MKHENHQSLGAFKLRGALNTIAQMTTKQKTQGVISSSTGNFGQGIAYAGQIFNVKVTVVVPEGTNADKVASMKRLGAELIFHGKEKSFEKYEFLLINSLSIFIVMKYYFAKMGT